MKIVISVEGNIASGKTTLMKALQERLPDADFFLEPVDKWTEEGWLDALYSDPKRFGFSFQIRVHQGFFEAKEEINRSSKQICVVERSSYSANKVFAKHLLNEEIIDFNEYKTLCKISSFTRGLHPHVTLYIKTDVKQCLKRMEERGREEEQGITEEYLTAIDTLHDDAFLYDHNVYVIDGNQSAEDVLKKAMEIISKVIE